MVQMPSKPDAVATPAHPRARKSFLVLAGLLSIAVAVGSGLAIATIRHVEGQLIKIDVGAGCEGNCLPDVVPEPKCSAKACTFLILGSDSREGFTENTNVEGQRADTIILVQVDPVNKRTIVLSIPRDLRVNIPGFGMNKINTAFSHGPNVMVKTVTQLTGIKINHYMEVNFVGFEGIVNALGGVPICVDRPLVDQLTGLNLPGKGCYNLKGQQALAFVRARHIEGDIIPDFSRISRQQQFMRAVIQKSLSIGSVTHLPDLIDAVKDNLVIDKNLNLYSLQDLTIKLAELGQHGVDFRVVPAVPETIGDVAYVTLLQPNASDLFRKIREGKKLGSLGRESPGTPISPANVAIRIFDADSGGQAQEVAAYLSKAGFDVGPVLSAPAELTKSQIIWGHGGVGESRVVSAYLTSMLVVYDNAHARASEITVVIGSDFPGID
jgi:LCP family protein required for cell wall assembly